MREIGKTISEHRKANGLSQKALSKVLAGRGMPVSSSAVCLWEKDATTPSAAQFLAVCEILGITDIYREFIGEYADDSPDPFEGLNAKGIERVKEYIRLLRLSDEFREMAADVIPIHRYLPKFTVPVSAGLGEFLDGDDYENIPVPSDVPEHATFALSVSGDSMEPRFHDRQTVWVERMEQINHGEIGIFCLNGEAYIKKLQDNEDGVCLISLNERYKPIRVKPDDSFAVLGRVLM